MECKHVSVTLDNDRIHCAECNFGLKCNGIPYTSLYTTRQMLTASRGEPDRN